ALATGHPRHRHLAGGAGLQPGRRGITRRHEPEAQKAGELVTADEPLLQVSNLRVEFATDAGSVPAGRGARLSVGVGETLALVGESGCGKSVTALSIMRLVGGRTTAGSIRFAGRELTTLSEPELRGIRGSRIGMIFQEPMTSLNPVLRLGRQI